MNLRPLLNAATASGALLACVAVGRADPVSAVNNFADQMVGWNVITSGNFSTNNHVHGTVASGGSVSLSGSAEINSHNHGNEGLRVYGNLNLNGETKVLAGGATVLQDGSVNSTIVLQPGQPNPNQGLITSNTGSLFFNGNGGTPVLSSLASNDGFFGSIDGVMQAANANLLNSGGLGATIIDSDTIYFNASGSGVSVFDWNVASLTGIGEVGFSFADDAFIVVNVIGGTTWDAMFNILGGSSTVAEHVLWNIGVTTVNFGGANNTSEILGSILAPNSTINSWKQLDGAIYAGELNQYNQEIHYHAPDAPPPMNVPDEPSLAVLGLAVLSLVIPAWRRSRKRS